MFCAIVRAFIKVFFVYGNTKAVRIQATTITHILKSNLHVLLIQHPYQEWI